MTIRVAPFTGSPDEWDRFVRASDGWTHFHLYGWRGVTERVFGHECVFLAATRDDGALAGVLPLVRVRSRLFGHFLVSMPFVSYGGPLGDDDAVRALADAAFAMGRRDHVQLVELRSRRPLPLDVAPSHRKITVVLDLPATADDLWTRLDRKIRNHVRRSRKEGITVRFGHDQIVPFFAVFAHNMRDLGTPTQPRRLFESIADAFGDDVWAGCAYLGDRPIAAGLAIRWGAELEMTWGSSLAAYNRFSPNTLLYWDFMERAIGAGVTVFNFGRCSEGSGTHRFKRQWGSRDEPLWWYDGFENGPGKTPSPDDPGYRWGPRVWRRLPTSLATMLGPHIVRYIP